jgi:hypothetical protein
MQKSVGVNDVIVRLQDVLAENNPSLKEAIGGAVDLDTVLDRTSMNPMSFHVAYGGATIPDQYIHSNQEVVLDKAFSVYVVLNTDKFNGRYPQSLLPTIERQLIHALWCWEIDDCHDAFLLAGDAVEYIDMGRYVHRFDFTVRYTIQYTEIDDEIHNDDEIGFFDTMFNKYFVGEDSEGNEQYSDQLIENIYNSGEPLN